MIRNVPVVEINRENFATFWPSILLNVRNATFISMDAELSGLGDRKKLNSKSVDDRYKCIAEAATSRSILSLGLSCFTETESLGNGEKASVARHLQFNVQTYNFMTLCEDDFVVESGAVRFLVDHGFDFNRQYSKGLPYRRGPVSNAGVTDGSGGITLQNLFMEILSAKKPLAFHNGMVDLIFLYRNLLAELPSSLQTFIADIVELFPAGIYDTKFITDFCARYPASYLEYVFRKCQRENDSQANSGQAHIVISFSTFTPTIEKWIERAECDIQPKRSNAPDNLCPVFAAHGWCKNGRLCTMSHDVDIVLDVENAKLEKRRAKRKRRQEARNKDTMSVSSKESFDNQMMDVDVDTDVPTSARSNDAGDMSGLLAVSNGNESNQDNQKSLPLYTGAHRAGYDAFMTAFSLAYLTLKLNQWPEGQLFDVALFKNKIALSGKDYPLVMQRSSFSKPSSYVQDIVKLFH